MISGADPVAVDEVNVMEGAQYCWERRQLGIDLATNEVEGEWKVELAGGEMAEVGNYLDGGVGRGKGVGVNLGAEFRGQGE